MNWLSDKEVAELLSVHQLVEDLDLAFAQESAVPRRSDLYIPQIDGSSNKLLIMPAWGKKLGVKTVIVAPSNKNHGLPTVQGTYQLINKKTGETVCFMDARTLTNRRTAAASALASNYLSRKDSSVLLMIGTGSLAPEMITAHCAVRPISKVIVWGRDENKAQHLAESLRIDGVKFFNSDDLATSIAEADIISCATTSPTPVLFGELLKPGQHVDLVGAYKTDMREADDEAILSSAVFVDVMSSVRESGEMAIPLKSELIAESHIRGDLHDLCSKRVAGRLAAEQITLFKSVGYALEDLVAAEQVWNNKLKENNG